MSAIEAVEVSRAFLRFATAKDAERAADAGDPFVVTVTRLDSVIHCWAYATREGASGAVNSQPLGSGWTIAPATRAELRSMLSSHATSDPDDEAVAEWNERYGIAAARLRETR